MTGTMTHKPITVILMVRRCNNINRDRESNNHDTDGEPHGESLYG